MGVHDGLKYARWSAPGCRTTTRCGRIRASAACPQGASRACIASKLATQVQLKTNPPTKLPCNPGLSPN